jgi:hypothetical protein
MYLDGKIQCWAVLCLFVLENRRVWVSEDFFETHIDSFFSKKKLFSTDPGRVSRN